MAARLTDEERRLRGLTPGELADQVGDLKADAAGAEAKIKAIKAECVRRKITEADGALFHISLSPPGEKKTVDIKTMRAELGDKLVDRFVVPTPVDWSLRCTAKPRARSAG